METQNLPEMPTLPDGEFSMVITPAAAARYQKMTADKGQPGFALRIRVVGGGCSGMSYEMGFEETPQVEDRILTFGTLRVFVDPKSIPYLHGVHIDYVSGLTSAGFKMKNPNAKSTCGCGESFN